MHKVSCASGERRAKRVFHLRQTLAPSALDTRPWRSWLLFLTDRVKPSLWQRLCTRMQLGGPDMTGFELTIWKGHWSTITSTFFVARSIEDVKINHFFVSPELSSVIVSPELSSVRDYVITHSVRSICMYVVFCKIDHCFHIHWCIVMGLGHSDPWVESHTWPQQTWGQRSSRGQWPLVQVFGKKGQCIHILWCIFKSNITMIAKYVIAKAGETRGSRTALVFFFFFFFVARSIEDVNLKNAGLSSWFCQCIVISWGFFVNSIIPRVSHRPLYCVLIEVDFKDYRGQ